MSRRSFNSVRSYFFRAEIAERDMAQREYGGIPIEAYDLDQFRSIWSLATSQAVTHIQRSLRTYSHARKQWEQRI